MTETDFLRALKSRNKGPSRNAAISLEEIYIKWLDSLAAQAGIGRGQVVRQLIEEKMYSLSPEDAPSPLKTTVTLHPDIALAVKRAGGNVNEIVNQALAQAFELEVAR